MYFPKTALYIIVSSEMLLHSCTATGLTTPPALAKGDEQRTARSMARNMKKGKNKVSKAPKEPKKPKKKNKKNKNTMEPSIMMPSVAPSESTEPSVTSSMMPSVAPSDSMLPSQKVFQAFANTTELKAEVEKWNDPDTLYDSNTYGYVS